ncbi:MAG: hypothetical protein ACHQ1D_00780 [Nitrososphaerales archaeon]
MLRSMVAPQSIGSGILRSVLKRKKRPEDTAVYGGSKNAPFAASYDRGRVSRVIRG